MFFEATPEQRLLRDNIRRFMQAEVAPLISRHDQEKTFPFEILKGLAQFGYIGGRLSEEQGGMGLDQLTWAMMMEEAGYAWLSLRTILNITNGPIAKLAAVGTPDQKTRFLDPLLACERKVFTAISEPGTGSNIAQIQTRADLKGDHYVLNGRKLWITNGAFADFGIVVARTYSDNCEGQLSTFLVEREVSPYEVRRVDTMVLRSTGTAELGFDNVRVPRENLLGEEGGALKRMLQGLDGARVNIAMGAVGAAQCALDLATDYAKTRTQFGRAIGSFQLVQKMIVDMTIRVEAARALGYRAAMALDRGEDTRVSASIAKLYATEAAHEVASMALQVHGGLGYATDYPIERIFRDTRGGTIPEGTTEVQTLIVGREILGMSAIA
ncbi:alkylation response protein AidB-like acyl-CoA dehydrogenase [Cupriavidus metallidurans]|jgi:alkylation response protein AidB-like acyl-CoA dehydrogenase|uniref:Acyl-CoA dehydrogenase n=2 Tax=Cupriavidus metallidurans TaxID=119219 RepID=Q1LK50_CUPMC|nr:MULTISPECIES: acyl-CoA dehydrogenase family protein [Cupriavidus]ABF09476.1 acyl-CoA dehydrogenase [Cupriavidus metallidurans CH34]AVA36658.1 acyl-CoA dehydrogenase [Cupriavidus metallidurans]KWR84940.1 acyl-CoA dehydrogenase [Cupriavidus sp. SHE]KWW37357.1 Acyl-CoA dehydrogenase, short-chain specific [Cupriavidus metallidurans]MDE4918987.1 acyl-CoA dehydrogenase family protein [Cupriavidus metallidurans]